MVDVLISYPENGKHEENSIIFDIQGNKEQGLHKSIINSLRRNGFHIVYIDPNWLYISWAKEDRGKVIKKTGISKKEKNYKLIDEYKPSGKFVNENDLSSIKMKTKQLF